MIIVRAPTRISFVGGGTDIASFYEHYPGRVISSAIDKFVYVAVNRPPLVKGVYARYSVSELVDHPAELKNDRIREALGHFGITTNIDVSSFSDVPIKSGLGSSSSFSVALIKALNLAQGKKTNPLENAEEAAHLEIKLVGEPIGKQDQYAAAFGGFNIFQFNSDHSVEVTPIMTDFRLKSEFLSHLSLFFSGIAREASSVLRDQAANMDKKFDVLKQMSDSVFEFRDRMLARDFRGLGKMLDSAWTAKKTLASAISNPIIDEFYSAGIGAGAWGGKILGAGGGGCILFISSPEIKPELKLALEKVALRHNLKDFTEIPFKFIQSGAQILLNHS